MIIERNAELIKKCISTSSNQLHLNTCREMINERIAPWGVFDILNELYNMIQVREVELIVTRYPVEEA